MVLVRAGAIFSFRELFSRHLAGRAELVHRLEAHQDERVFRANLFPDPHENHLRSRPMEGHRRESPRWAQISPASPIRAPHEEHPSRLLTRIRKPSKSAL